MKKTVVIITAALSVMLFAGCTKEETKTSYGKVYKIGVIQLVEHAALDRANQGFVDGLKESGIAFEIDQQNAQGDQTACDTIASKLVNDGNDLILAIATPAAQAVAGKTKDVPILVTAVTDPASSGLVETNEAPGGNVTGTSDLTPVKEQIELLTQMLPDVKTVGILYCTAEDNSRFQADIAKAELEKAGLAWKEFTVSTSNEIQSVVESMIGKVDCIYAPTDNVISAGMTTVAMVANDNLIPTIVGESAQVEAGALATYGIDYYNLGKLTAAQAVKILKGEAAPATMPIEYLAAEKCEFAGNEETATLFDVDLSAFQK